MNFNNWQTQLRKGLLELAVLNLLQHGRCHGYEMAQILKQSSGLKIREGNIYPILSRLQIDGLVVSSSEASTDGPPRKYFELTKLGKKVAADMNEHWEQIVGSIKSLRKGTFI